MSLAQHDHVVEALPPDRPDDPFAVAILPGRPGGGDDLFNAQDLQSIDDFRTVGAIPIPGQIPRGGIEGKRLDQLQPCPLRSGVSSDVEVNDSSSVEGQDQDHLKRPEGCGRHSEEVDGNDVGLMWFRMKVCHVWSGWLGRRTMYLAIEDWKIAKPSFSNSP
jgi:hypothetical protein